MPVKLRITLLFTLLVFFILGLVCVSTYYFSYQARVKLITIRLTNRAITTARLLSHSGVFDRSLVERIDSLTTLSLQNKSVQAYDFLNEKIYNYSDAHLDTVVVTTDMLDDTRVNQHLYFSADGKDIVSYYYTGNNAKLVMVCAARDVEGKRNLEELKNILLLSFFAGLGVAFIGGYFFSSRLLSRIRKITKEVTEISAYNLTRRIDPGVAKDEWYKLSQTLNDLLNRLQESFELQRRFISNASHELSTPLTAIMSQLEIALQRERSSEEYRRVISSVIMDVRNMAKLTQTLLEFAKASGNKGGLEINLVRIDEIVMELPAMLQKQDGNYEVFLDFGQLPENEDDLLVFGNNELLVTALRNIVTNACKYSDDHKAIVSLLVTDSQFRIDITDKGQGIPLEEMANIFEPFYRASNYPGSKGFGLGLPLAYRIIKLHKGEISVVSQPGSGTVFTVVLPSAKSPGF